MCSNCTISVGYPLYMHTHAYIYIRQISHRSSRAESQEYTPIVHQRMRLMTSSQRALAAADPPRDVDVRAPVHDKEEPVQDDEDAPCTAAVHQVPLHDQGQSGVGSFFRSKGGSFEEIMRQIFHEPSSEAPRMRNRYLVNEQVVDVSH